MLCPKCDRLSRCPCDTCKQQFPLEKCYTIEIRVDEKFQICPYCTFAISAHNYAIWEFRRYKFWKIVNRDL